MADMTWIAVGLFGLLAVSVETLIPACRAIRRNEQAGAARSAQYLAAGLWAFYDARDWSILHGPMSHIPCEFLLEARQSVEQFGSKVGAACLPRCTLQAPLRRASTWIFVRSLRRARVFVLGVMSFAVLVTAFVRYVQHDLFEDSQGEFEAALRAIDMLANTHGIVLGLCTFVIAGYAMQCVLRLHQLMDLAHAVKASVDNLGFLVGANFQPPLRHDPVIKLVLWTVFRLANAAHFCTYTGLSERMNIASQEQSLSQVGLLTREELEVLGKYENKAITVLHWLSDLVNKLISAEIIPDAPAHAMLDGLGEVMKCVNAVDFEVRFGQPVLLLRLVHAMLYITSLLTPLALLSVFQENDRLAGDSFSMYLWPSLGSGVVAFFLKTAVSTAETMESPLYGGFDSLNLDHMLLTSETFIYSYLSGDARVPDLVARVAEVEALPLPPPVDRTPVKESDGSEPTMNRAKDMDAEIRSIRSDASRLSDAWIGSELSFGSRRSYASKSRSWDARFSARRPSRKSSIVSSRSSFMPASASVAGDPHLDEDDDDKPVICAISKDLLESRWSQLEKPRKVTLDVASLQSLEDALVRPLAALVRSLPGAGTVQPHQGTFPKVSQLSSASTPFAPEGLDGGLKGAGPQGHTSRPDVPYMRTPIDEEPEGLII